MKKRRFLKRFLSLMSVMVVVLSFSVMGFSAAADEPIVIAIHNTDAKDDNPLIRVFMPKSTFGSGGPFTIKLEYKLENFGRINSKEDPILLFDIYTLQSMGNDKTQEARQFKVTENSNGWQELKANQPNTNKDWITVENVTRLPMGSDMPEHWILNMGLCWAKGDVYFRNFRIENAAGEVVYSWDTDPDLIDLLGNNETASLRDIGDINPQPVVLNVKFGEGDAALYTVSRGDADTGPEPTEAPVYENPTGGGSDSTTAPPDNNGTQPTAGGDTSGETTDPSDSSADGTTTGDSSDVDTTDPDASGDTPAGMTTVPNTSDGGEGEEGGGLSAGWIVLIVVGGVIVVAAIVFGILFALKKLPFQKTGESGE